LANLFELEPEVVKNLSMTVRREQYGTAELSEFLSDLTWKALAHQMRTIMFGSPDMAQKAASVVMSKALASSVRQTPEEVSRAREMIMAVARQERLIELEGETVESTEASAFVAMDEPTDDQRQERETELSGS
jgi:hypothetical protein